MRLLGRTGVEHAPLARWAASRSPGAARARLPGASPSSGAPGRARRCRVARGAPVILGARPVGGRLEGAAALVSVDLRSALPGALGCYELQLPPDSSIDVEDALVCRGCGVSVADGSRPTCPGGGCDRRKPRQSPAAPVRARSLGRTAARGAARPCCALWTCWWMALPVAPSSRTPPIRP